MTSSRRPVMGHYSRFVKMHRQNTPNWTQLIQAARETATECVQLAAKFTGQPTDIAERLAKHLSKDRIQLIRLGLIIPTFRMDIAKKADGKYLVKLSRKDRPFMTGNVLHGMAPSYPSDLLTIYISITLCNLCAIMMLNSKLLFFFMNFCSQYLYLCCTLHATCGEFHLRSQLPRFGFTWVACVLGQVFIVAIFYILCIFILYLYTCITFSCVHNMCFLKVLK